jgi:hypothetical protein
MIRKELLGVLLMILLAALVLGLVAFVMANLGVSGNAIA